MRADLELVALAVGEIGNEDLPDAGRRQQPHRWTRPSQPLKSPMTLTRSAFGAQTAKCTPVVDADGDAVRAELLERAVVRALAEQVQIEVGEHAAVAVRIVDLDDVIAGKRQRGDDSRQSTRGRPACRPSTTSLEDARRIALRHRHAARRSRPAGRSIDSRRRLERADDEPRPARPRAAEHRERIAVRPADERVERGVDGAAFWRDRHLSGSYRL